MPMRRVKSPTLKTLMQKVKMKMKARVKRSVTSTFSTSDLAKNPQRRRNPRKARKLKRTKKRKRSLSLQMTKIVKKSLKSISQMKKVKIWIQRIRTKPLRS